MAQIASSLVDLIGNTPLLELVNYGRRESLDARIIAKLEYFNPGGSVKDRVADAMVAMPKCTGVCARRHHHRAYEPAIPA